MANEIISPLTQLEDAEAAYKRVEPEANALTEDQFTAMNVDVVGASSIILGVAPRILAHRERMERLTEFDVRHVDGLVDRAKAAWYAVITNLPAAEPKDFEQMFAACVALRAKFLVWLTALVHEGVFEQAALDKIKEGSGNKDVPSDVVACVALFRSKWDQVRPMSAVTEADLARGAQIGPAVFATVSRRENKLLASQSDGSLRVRRFWTLADRSYDQCQRAIQYLQWDVGDAAVIAPSLRRNTGRGSGSSAQPAPTPVPAPDGPALGDETGPFVR
jgi:hypothetical protein